MAAKLHQLTDDQKRDLEFLKMNAEPKLFQRIDRNGSDNQDEWFITAEGDVDSLDQDDIVAEYMLVGYRGGQCDTVTQRSRVVTRASFSG